MISPNISISLLQRLILCEFFLTYIISIFGIWPSPFPLCALNFKLYSSSSNNAPYDSGDNLRLYCEDQKPCSQPYTWQSQIPKIEMTQTHTISSQSESEVRKTIASDIWFIPFDMSLRDSSENKDSKPDLGVEMNIIITWLLTWS